MLIENDSYSNELACIYMIEMGSNDVRKRYCSGMKNAVDVTILSCERTIEKIGHRTNKRH